MANPQKDNGYTAIANEILDQLVKAGLLGSEYAICFVVIRKTYGFQKKIDRISLTQFEELTNLSRPTVVHTLKNLVIKNILVKTPLLLYGINKDWEKWLVKTPKLVKWNGSYSKDALTKTSKDALTHKRKKEIYTKEIIGEAPKNEVNELIDFFKQTVNPHISFANKTERQASDDLIKTYSLEQAKKALLFLEEQRKTNKYLPVVTTPYELWTKWAKIKSLLIQNQVKRTRKIWKPTTQTNPAKLLQ